VSKLLVELYLDEDVDFAIILAVRRSPHELVNRLLQLLNEVTADELKNQVRYLF
jgi:hypothetical protein